MAYFEFFLSGCNLILLLLPKNDMRWLNGMACVACFFAGLISAGVI